MTRSLIPVLVALTWLLVAAGCGAGEAAPPMASTSLVIRANNTVAGTAVFTLRCDPPGGTLPDPKRACGRLSAASAAVLLMPRGYLCPGTALSPWSLRVSGHRGDHPVHVNMATCWTPQVPLIRALGVSWSQIIHAAHPAG